MTSRRILGVAVAVLGTLMLAGCGFAVTDAIPPAPPLERPIVDTTKTLTTSEVDELSGIIDKGRAVDGRETAVLVVASVGTDTIEEYSIDVARDWGVGKADADNGILIVVAVEDREFRIEVGRGLEGDIPDATARRIGDELMVPHMKDDDLFGAVKAGVAAVQPGGEREAVVEESGGGFPWFVPLIILGAVVLIGLGGASGSGGGRRSGSGSSLYAGGSGASRSSRSSFGGGGFSGGGSSSSW